VLDTMGVSPAHAPLSAAFIRGVRAFLWAPICGLIFGRCVDLYLHMRWFSLAGFLLGLFAGLGGLFIMAQRNLASERKPT
jgi:hypothetical protein